MDVIKNEQQRDRANFWLQMIVACVVLTVSIATLAALVFVPTRTENSGFNIWLGAVIGWVGILLAFCFPNNIGQAKQQDTINKLVEKTPPQTGEAKEALDELNSGRTEGAGAGTPADRNLSGGDPIRPGAVAEGAGSESPLAAGTIPTEPPAVRVGQEIQPRS